MRCPNIIGCRGEIQIDGFKISRPRVKHKPWWGRTFAAWLVFTGQADALVWPSDQDKEVKDEVKQ